MKLVKKYDGSTDTYFITFTTMYLICETCMYTEWGAVLDGVLEGIKSEKSSVQFWPYYLHVFTPECFLTNFFELHFQLKLIS